MVLFEEWIDRFGADVFMLGADVLQRKDSYCRLDRKNQYWMYMNLWSPISIKVLVNFFVQI